MYTYFDKTKKVLCVLQIANANQAEKKDHPVMPHNETLEHEEVHQFDSIVG